MSTSPKHQKKQSTASTNDFVSVSLSTLVLSNFYLSFQSDVNEALQEARLIVTKGKHKEQPHQNLIEESTTVQVKNSGSRTDPVEVFISRSTKTTQDSGTISEEEEEEIIS
jgi:hypothetical protein